MFTFICPYQFLSNNETRNKFLIQQTNNKSFYTCGDKIWQTSIIRGCVCMKPIQYPAMLMEWLLISNGSTAAVNQFGLRLIKLSSCFAIVIDIQTKLRWWCPFPLRQLQSWEKKLILFLHIRHFMKTCLYWEIFSFSWYIPYK